MLGEALELPRIAPKGTDEIRLAGGPLHGHRDVRVRSRCATSSDRTARRCGA